MDQLIGEYNHKFDTKYRLSLPSKIRSVLGETVIVTKGLDGCVYVYSATAWQQITDNLRALSLGQSNARSLSRYILSAATEVTVDKSGRILIPELLRNTAKLDQQVVIAGVGNRLELWNPESWEAEQTKLLSEIDDIAETLGQINMI